MTLQKVSALDSKHKKGLKIIMQPSPHSLKKSAETKSIIICIKYIARSKRDNSENTVSWPIPIHENPSMRLGEIE